MSLELMVGLSLLVALIVVIVLFARLFGPGIARSAGRVASGKADGSDVLPALMAVGVVGADSSSCDAGGGGCD
jgi:hypothetical protein